MRYLASLPFLLLASQAFAQPDVASALQPQGPWKLDYADEECRLVRTFGTGQQTLVVRLARGSGLQQFDMVIAGNSIPKLPKQIKVALRLDGQDKEQEFDAYSMQVPNRPERFVRWYDGESSFLAEFTENQVITVKSGAKFSVSFNLTSARAAVAALDACHVDLLTSWGLDVNSLKAAKVPPRPIGSPANWATTSDYPSDALRAGQGGSVRFLLIVGADGMPTRCSIARSSGVPQLDAVTCQLAMRRARFKPAENGEGQPIAGYYVNRVRWIIPE